MEQVSRGDAPASFLQFLNSIVDFLKGLFFTNDFKNNVINTEH